MPPPPTPAGEAAAAVEASPQAVIVSGSGTSRANGVYAAAKGKERCGAPVYEHADRGAALLITREPHTSKKTGKTSHGWLLGDSGSPLYGAQTESLSLPSNGWRRFGGEEPLPTCQAFARLADAYFSLADEAWSQGEDAADRESWQVAHDAFGAGLEALKRSGERSGIELQRRAVLLLAGRASAGAMLQRPGLALRDAAASLCLSPGLHRAEATAVAALVDLGCRNEAAARKLLQTASKGKLLDPARPWALGPVDQWVKEVVEQARSGGPESEPEEDVESDVEDVGSRPRASLQWLLDCEKAVDEEEASRAEAAREERLAGYRNFSDKTDSAPQLLQLRVRDPQGKEVCFRHSRSKPMLSWMQSYIKCWGLEDAQVAFMVDGMYEIGPEDTAQSMGIEDDFVVEVLIGRPQAA